MEQNVVRKILRIFIGVIAISLTIGLYGCDEIKQVNEPNTENLHLTDFVGTWRAEKDMEVYYLLLKSDGSGRYVVQNSYLGVINNQSITWIYDNQRITIRNVDITQFFSVSHLSEKLMVLNYEKNTALYFYRIDSNGMPEGTADETDDPNTSVDQGNSDEQENSDTDIIKTISADARAFSATIFGFYSGSITPSTIGVEYSYDKSFPAKQTGGYCVEGHSGAIEFKATGLVDLAKVYYRVFAIVDGKRVDGETKSFETLQGTYSIDGKTYKFIKVTGLATGSFSMMQTELPPSSEVLIDGQSIGSISTTNKVTAGDMRDFLNKFANVAVVPRYPTPQEWLFASNGGTISKGYIYSGSDDIDAVGWYSGNSNGHARKVAQKSANELGFFDMSGNYAELCSLYDEEQLENIREKYIKRFVKSLLDVSAEYFDISWKAKGGAFGGTWNSNSLDCRSNSHIQYITPANTNQFDGNKYTIRLVYSRPD